MPATRVAARWGVKSLKPALIIVGFLGVMALLGQKLAEVDFSTVWQLFHSVPPLHWAMAAITTFISFAALGRYDVMVHRMLGNNLSTKTAMTSGMCGIAIGQVIGFGMFSGALARWRLLPGLPFARVVSVSVLAGVSFLIAWAVLASIAVSFSPFPAVRHLGFWPLAAVTVILVAGFVVTLRMPAKLALFWPSKTAVGRFLIWAFIDTAAASLTLYILLPSSVDLAWHTLFTAYLLALGAGLIANTPGGVGAFELCLLSLLPQVGSEPLLAAILAFRVIYYAIPAGIALAVLAKNPKPVWDTTNGCLIARPHLATTLTAQTVQAEAGLVNQRQTQYLTSSHQPLHARWLSIPMAHHLVAMGKPLGEDFKQDIALFQSHAKARLKTPCFYKTTPRVTASLRRAGYACVKVSQEAILNPQTFSVEGASFRQLRRLLRKAEAIETQDLRPYEDRPMGQLTAIAKGWAVQKKEQGLSMGRFCPTYLAAQRIFLAYEGDEMVGFISFHVSPSEWTLDLVRIASSAPAGTSQKLILAAISAAKTDTIPRLSLAAAPLADQPVGGWIGALARRNSIAGLRRFKQSFDPIWEPRYMVAPNRFELAFVALNLWWSIAHPTPLKPLTHPKNPPIFHNKDENYEFALSRNT